MAIFASGSNRWSMPATSWIFCIRLLMKKTCPPRDSSYWIPSLINDSWKPTTCVSMGCRLAGGVFMTDKSLAAIKENCMVLGMGVAVRVSVSTLTLRVLSLSLMLTPNFCSSSTTKSPKSLKWTSLLTNLWVPIKISTLPIVRSARMRLTSLLLRVRLRYSTRTGN